MNHIKMGYTNWKQVVASIANSPSALDGKQFLNFWRSALRAKYPTKRIKQAWARFVKENNAGSWAEQVFNSTAISQLAKDIACANNGSQGPERKLKDGESWDARNEYSLAGGTKGYTDEQHAEL